MEKIGWTGVFEKSLYSWFEDIVEYDVHSFQQKSAIGHVVRAIAKIIPCHLNRYVTLTT
jgi:hypothetical protein